MAAKKSKQSQEKKWWVVIGCVVGLLAVVVVHSDELLSPHGHDFDKAALQSAVSAPEVQAWVQSLGPLAPVKRNASQR